MKRMHTKYVRQLLPAPSSAQDLPEIRRRGRRLELIVLTTFACTRMRPQAVACKDMTVYLMYGSHH
jgi:hypothetical protein